jgi:hypothetical protein
MTTTRTQLAEALRALMSAERAPIPLQAEKDAAWQAARDTLTAYDREAESVNTAGMTTPRYTLAAGRAVRRDGERFANIARVIDPATGASPDPTDVDDFARNAVRYANCAEALAQAVRELIRIAPNLDRAEIAAARTTLRAFDAPTPLAD